MTPAAIEQEFLKIYEKYADDIYRYCFFRLYEKEKATDCMQESFTKAWQYLCDGNDVKNIRALVYKIANNLIIDSVRKKKEASLEAMEEDGFAPGKRMNEMSDNFLDAKDAVSKLSQLEKEYREPIYMRYIENLNPRDIAEITGETVNVISVRIHRGLKQLKKIL
jgi:RNA polymerase sigma factor (sigma-70 family)